MTRKHFKAIAEILREHSAGSLPTDHISFLRDRDRKLVEDVASYFQTQNPLFDKQRFLDAVYKD